MGCGCFVSPTLSLLVVTLLKGRRSKTSATSRYSSLLLSVSADVRSFDGVIAVEGLVRKRQDLFLPFRWVSESLNI